MRDPAGAGPDAPAPALHHRAGALVLVALGGAAGTAARYGLARWAPTRPGHWPTGTFVANVVGSLVLGVLLEALVRAGPDTGIRLRTRLLLGAGFCGGFTTYSTFAVEVDLLARDHHPGLAVGYVAASLVAGTVAAALGVLVAGAAARLRRAR